MKQNVGSFGEEVDVQHEAGAVGGAVAAAAAFCRCIKPACLIRYSD